MSKGDIHKSSLHVYVQITIIYPNCNLCIQMVIHMSKMTTDIYPNAVSMVRFINNFTKVTQFFDIFSGKYYL